MERDSLKTANAERRKSVVVLQASAFALDQSLAQTVANFAIAVSTIQSTTKPSRIQTGRMRSGSGRVTV
jgi:hypothetical protein